MSKTKKITPIILLVFMLMALMATACSPNKAERLNNEGNEAFAQQAFQEALVDYQTAQIEEPQLAEPYYNAANALYRQGQYEAALEQLNMALSFAEQETLATDSFFNLGNTAYSMQDLGAAVAAYTESLLLNPHDQDAKYNLELALQQQQQQEQEQQEENQEDQEQDQQNQDQSSEGENQEDQEQSEGDQQQEEPSQEGEGEQEQQQEQGREESEQEQDSDQSQDGQQQEQDGQPQSGQAGDEQPQGQPSQVPAPGQRMTEEQAQQLLAAIAGDSQTLQEKLGQIFAVPWNPPAQDW